MGVVKDDELVAVVAYHNWDQRADVMEMSAASTHPKWLSPKVLRTMYGYPFDVAKVQMVVKRVSKNNTGLLDQFKRLGFTLYEIPRLRGRDENEIICTLTQEDWAAGKFSGDWQDG